MKHKKQISNVIKALHQADRDLQFERNGYDHPWTAITIAHKNKKLYNRKRDRKNFNYSDGLIFFFVIATL